MDAGSPPLPTRREELLARLAQAEPFDLAVVGGGASGLGVALDAAARGFRVVLLEAHDFAKGTSSRSTKLVHGGVRYLAQGHLHLVREALRERSRLLANAPHLAQPLPFVMPAYRGWEKLFYGLGLKLYDALAGPASLGATELLNVRQALAALPTVRREHLLGGVRYWDAQFDDARLALALARTAARQGALLLNYCPVSELLREREQVVGLRCADAETGRGFVVRARCVVNATGVWADALGRRDGYAAQRAVDGDGLQPRLLVRPSQGVHLVVDRDFLPGDSALLVPKTTDGRVLFAVPWLGKLILGTTDTPRDRAEIEPRPLAQEVDFLLKEAGRYLERAPTRQDVRSAWAGLRPLIRPTATAGAAGTTRGLSREHMVRVSRGGLVTVGGGKWTTYRAMAEDVLECCFAEGLLDRRQGGVTANLPLVGAMSVKSVADLQSSPGLHLYGLDEEYVLTCGDSSVDFGGGLTDAMVRFAVRYEYARSVEDVLARRSRLLFLDARQARLAAPGVADILREEAAVDPGLEAFGALADRYANPS